MAACVGAMVYPAWNTTHMRVGKMKKSTSVWYKSRRFWILASSILFFGVVAAYGLWSKVTWEKLEYSEEVKVSIVRQVEVALALPSTTPEERKAKKEALQQATGAMQASGDPCYVADFIVWQQFIGDLKQRQHRCIENKNKIHLVDEKLRLIVTFLQDDADTAQALAKLQAQKPEIGEADFLNAAAIWEEALKEVRTVKAGEQFLPVQQALVLSLEIGAGKWKELISAHEAKNKAGFLKVQRELAAASDQLITTRELEQKELAKLVEAFRVAFISLY